MPDPKYPGLNVPGVEFEEDEPLFLLRGKDPLAGPVVRMYANLVSAGWLALSVFGTGAGRDLLASHIFELGKLAEAFEEYLVGAPTRWPD